MNRENYIETRLMDELKNKFEGLQFDFATKTLEMLSSQDSNERQTKALEMEIILSEIRGIEWTVKLVANITKEVNDMEDDEEESLRNSFILNMEKLFDTIPGDDDNDYDNGDLWDDGDGEWY